MSQRDDHAMHADPFRCAKQCAEVLRILQRVEDQDQGQFAFFLGIFENLDHVAVWISADFRGNALMI